MTSERDDLARGAGDGDTTDPPVTPPILAPSSQTAELLHNPRARAKVPRQPTPEPIRPPDTTAALRPGRRAASIDDGADPAFADGADDTGEAPLPGRADPMSVTQPSFGPRGPARSPNSLITVPAWSSPQAATTDEIAQRVRERPPAFPLPRNDHYQAIRFLGEGGMGKVFLARDLRLGREVAIKFVRGDSRDHTLRLLAEARAQAQVNHDRVCKVYEVDEVDGQVYIAMQYIDGEPLGALAGELTIEQKVMVVRDAAEGVHAAHRVGIVHRDLNPNNIMVERDHDGRLRSYVMDFGLARDRKEGATETGTVMGTPHYMSPEQARGEVGRLDRRADIYSLGASLYVLLTGQQAIPGDNGLVVLNNIQLVEPRRLRAIDPDIPIDLEAITLRCLEKDRSARYDSARALAEDLGRFLDGEPVLARRAGLGYRLRKRVKKHWQLLTASTLVLAALIAALAWGLHARADGQRARREAALRERLAREFTERVESIEASARYSALARLHDIRADRRALAARMDELAVDVTLAGPLARGPGHYALGRGLLALGDHDRARGELQEAWASGYVEPRVAYALALVLGAQYQRGLASVERIPNEKEREAAKRALERDYRDPALSYLKRSRHEASGDYVTALIAYYENRFDDALRTLDAIDTPWFYEAPELRGDIHLARAVKAARAGQRAEALAEFDAGRAAYTAAIATGESVPDLHLALAGLEQAAIDFGMYDQAAIDAPFARGLAAIDHALVVLPDSVDALVLQATLYRRVAEFRSVRGVAIDELIAHAIEASRRAIAIDPESAKGWQELSRAYWAWAEDRERRSEDPSAQLTQAIDASDRVAEADRDEWYYVSRGLIFKLRADRADSLGQDSAADRNKAIEAYERALVLQPDDLVTLINLAANYYERAGQDVAEDPDKDLAAAGAALRHALEINPNHPAALFYQAKVSEVVGLRAELHGGDPRPDLARALEHYRKGIAINATLPYLHHGAGMVLLDQASDAWNRGGDPEPLLREAAASFERGIAAAPDQWYGANNLGEVARRRATFLRDGGADARAAARDAVARFERALAASPSEPLLVLNTGIARALVADATRARGGDPEPAAAAADAAFATLLAQNPDDGDAGLGRAWTAAIRAEARAQRGAGREQDFAAAADAYERALAKSPDDQEAHLDAAALDLAWAQWALGAGRDPGPAITRGLALADQLLAVRVGWASARAVRGGLLLVQAQAATSPDQRRALAARAAEELTGAITTNANLDNRWRASATKAQQLAAP